MNSGLSKCCIHKISVSLLAQLIGNIMLEQSSDRQFALRDVYGFSVERINFVKRYNIRAMNPQECIFGQHVFERRNRLTANNGSIDGYDLDILLKTFDKQNLIT